MRCARLRCHLIGEIRHAETMEAAITFAYRPSVGDAAFHQCEPVLRAYFEFFPARQTRSGFATDVAQPARSHRQR